MKRLFAFATFLVLSGCQSDNYATFNGFEQGTTYTIVVKNPSTEVAGRIDATFEEMDMTFSMFNPASLTGRINRGETEATTPLFDDCFAIAKRVNKATEGYFDSTIKPLIDAWGFGPGEMQREPDVETLMEYVGMDKIHIEGGRVVKADPRVQLDFSSIAKGFTVDKLAEMLEDEGATDYMVEVGGEVRVKGVNAAGRAWRIGIDKPVPGLVSRELEEVVVLRRSSDDTADSAIAFRAIATSGNYRNQFVDESGRTRVHTIDPLTGMPVMGEILSVSIVAAECALADAWATGIMASGTLQNARRLLAGNDKEIEYYVVHSTPEGGMVAFHSEGFPVEAK